VLLGGCWADDDDTPSSVVPGAFPSPKQSLNHHVGATAQVPGLPAPLPALSGTDDPAVLLGAARVIDNSFQPGGRDANSPFPLIKLAGTAAPFPTGKWTKAFHYQIPASLSSNFVDAPGNDPNNGKNNTSSESVFAYPNKLNLDDRVPMVSAAFARPRFIAPGIDPTAAVYQLNNRYLIDEVLYPIVASDLADVFFAGSTGRDSTLVRSIVQQDELTITTRWQSSDGARQMDLIAATGSPYVTVRYQGLPAVIGVGASIRQRFTKDSQNLPIDPQDYSLWEVTNGIVAVAASNGNLAGVASQKFNESGVVETPDLTGTAFRIVYRVPDPARPLTPRTNNNQAPVEPLIDRVMNVYASSPITLTWDVPSRTYVTRTPFNGTLRAAFVGEQVIANIATDQPELLAFDEEEAVLAAHAGEVPIAGQVLAQYDGSEAATLKFAWTTRNIDGSTAPDASRLLMMAFDATQTKSIQDATPTTLGAASNFGRMTGMVGGTWTQNLTVPAILRDLPDSDSAQLWYGSGTIKAADRARVIQELQREGNDTQTFITHCNYDSYNCGKYIAQLGRLALIADQLGQADMRRQLVAFMKQNLNPWFDAADPGDPEIQSKVAAKIFDFFIYDRTNGGTVTFRPHNRADYTDDYYNLVYTDHMFHYGYFIYAASVISKLDEDTSRAWYTKYKPYVDLLVRDVANTSAADAYYPVMRMFDWFRGQHIADAGPTAHGGNTESSSESINFDYALALWGDITGNGQLKALASVMTAVEIRSAQAFYQVTPQASVFRSDREQAGVVPVTVTVKTAAGNNEQRTLDPNTAITRGIVWSHISENNDFFGARKAYLTGIQALPITPISEYVLNKAWVAARAADIRAVEDVLTANYTTAITEVPGPTKDCHVFAVKTPPDVQPPTPPDTYNWGGGCAAAARQENAWRQVLVSLGGLNDPAGTYGRFTQMVDLSIQQADYFTSFLSNPVKNPGSSTDANGSLPDLIRQTNVPSTNTNVMWWLSMLKPQ
jgi:endoglucanase Acf2